jgi:hypothetical protein
MRSGQIRCWVGLTVTGKWLAAKVPGTCLTSVLSASFDRAALDIESGGEWKDYRYALAEIISGLMGKVINEV